MFAGRTAPGRSRSQPVIRPSVYGSDHSGGRGGMGLLVRGDVSATWGGMGEAPNPHIPYPARDPNPAEAQGARRNNDEDLAGE